MVIPKVSGGQPEATWDSEVADFDVFNLKKQKITMQLVANHPDALTPADMERAVGTLGQSLCTLAPVVPAINRHLTHVHA